MNIFIFSFSEKRKLRFRNDDRKEHESKSDRTQNTEPILSAHQQRKERAEYRLKRENDGGPRRVRVFLTKILKKECRARTSASEIQKLKREASDIRTLEGNGSKPKCVQHGVSNPGKHRRIPEHAGDQ